jgi:isopentenyl-diphosphate delta-isomerase
MIKPVVLVNKSDKVVGYKEKTAAHKVPVSLHRAISVIIFSRDKEKMLITKRALTKPTWGGLWSNAVCSHPYPGETYQKAAERRLREELGLITSLKELFRFKYKANMDGGVWGECELDHVFTGNYEGAIKPDPDEIDGYEWISIGDLKKDVKKHPQKYTPWFKVILEKLKI